MSNEASLSGVGQNVCASLSSSLSKPFELELDGAQAADAGSLSFAIDAGPIVLRVQVGDNWLAVLLDPGIAAVLAALGRGDEPEAGTALSEEDISSLNDLLPIALASLSGVTDTEAMRMDPEGAEELLGLLGAGAQIASGAVLVGDDLTGTMSVAAGEAIIDALGNFAAPSGPAAAGSQPLVSDAEMNDILSGFRPEDEPDAGGNGRPMPENIDMVLGIELVATVRLGKVSVPIKEVLEYGPGSIIEVGQLVDDPVEFLVNDKLVARGDVVVVDEKFGLRITEIISPQERIESLR